MYNTQLENNMANLTELLFTLYGKRWDFYQIIDRLEKIMSEANKARDKSLLKLDKEAAEGKDFWYQSEKTVGMMLYVDLFAGNLRALVEKIPYFEELGVNYVHLMPLFDCPKGENDGGYAISSYRKVQPRLGTIEDLKFVADEFHKKGIRLVLDFVFNHTSDEHEWALKAKKGEEKYMNYYYMYKDKAEVDDWNRNLREIFPTVRRGSFTYLEKQDIWVWTTFNSFQWDLNYSNPEVFLAMCEEMLAIANLGVDVLRLDALAFVWKEKGTVCESLPKAHTLIKAFQYVARIACPSLVFKSEAIVHPDQVVQYIHKDECAISYNPLQMALLWSTVATRDTRLLNLSLKKRWYIPGDCSWVNYIRCHDDIGWTFSDEDASSLGINGFTHRQFLNRFFTGRFDGTFASGEPFQLNPTTGDCRICGTMASLAGLEQAEKLKNELLEKMAVARLQMMYAVVFALPGIPLLYANDEKAVFNDYSYRDRAEQKDDSRWVHRIKTDWKEKLLPAQKEVNDFLKKVIKLRKQEKMLGGTEIFFYDVQDPAVFAFRRGTIHVVANFSERPASAKIDAWSKESKDLLTGKIYENYFSQELGPYEVRWLSEVL
ncbi:amylosucrase [Treponema sp. C6A8]|uniref:amylosucrase n=1 Tax=Treponema sp. C6A8 TaxID=1410609 RepID=UPI000485C12E|nr:amylosucrase [Treponema sp. C6A8]